MNCHGRPSINQRWLLWLSLEEIRLVRTRAADWLQWEEMEGTHRKSGSLCRATTMLTLRWLRLTRSISGVSGKSVPAPKSSLYWIFSHGEGVKVVSCCQLHYQQSFDFCLQTTVINHAHREQNGQHEIKRDRLKQREHRV